jgi:peroxiredoxin
LSEQFGKGNTVLLFFPMAFTGTCTTEMCSVSEDISAYSGLNATVYGISGDNPSRRKRGRRRRRSRCHC